MGWIIAGILILLLLGGIFSRRIRRKTILAKYGQGEVANAIIRRAIWQGQTEGQLIDSLGRPSDIDQKVMKARTREVWKYRHQGGNRYGLRITLENGIVVGWDEK